MTRLGLFWVVIAALIMSACSDKSPREPPASTPHQVETTRAEGHEGRFVGAITRQYTYGNPGITMTAPPASARPDISWTSAFHACFAASLGCVTHGNAVVSLALVTGPGSATVDGRSMFEGALTYVVVWDSAACFPSDRAGRECHEVDLITAQDGNVPAGTHPYTFEVPGSAPVPTA